MKILPRVAFFLIIYCCSFNITASCLTAYERKIVQTSIFSKHKYATMIDLIQNISNALDNSSYEKLRLDLKKRKINLPNQCPNALPAVIRRLIARKYISEFDNYKLMCKDEDNPLTYKEFLSHFGHFLKIIQKSKINNPTIVKVPDKLYRMLEDCFEKNDTPLTSEETNSIRRYMAYGDYQEINKGLRLGTMEEKYFLRAKEMISGLKKLEISPGDFPLYRGSDFFPGIEKNSELKKGQILVNKSFLSTSDMEGKNLPGKFQMKIYNNKSGRILSSLINQEMINILQAVEDENEVLFFPGSKFKYLGREENLFKPHLGNYYVFEELK